MEIHYTTTEKTGLIWTFECLICGYKAVYNAGIEPHTFNVDNIGNPDARHTNSWSDWSDDPGLSGINTDPITPIPGSFAEIGESETDIVQIGYEAWLPKHIVVKIVKIVNDSDPVLVKEGFNSKPSLPSY